ncbi:hypothetical protein INT44_007940 [Umbelopsis vinacea]|uniref:Uncharacterized protein n=1 Tax=Umbelopsis vinacea TaxID=44442 RepID=A0A8H7UFH8_9FUNG|nr:hypothetical protein INT44_007940 [Umbelopsis vinacea]
MSERSTIASIVEAEYDASPSYNHVAPVFCVVLCITHGCCYTRQNLSRHLFEKHQLKGRERQRIESSSQLNDIATSSTAVVDFRSTNRNQMQKHYNKLHQWKFMHEGAVLCHGIHANVISAEAMPTVLCIGSGRPGPPVHINHQVQSQPQRDTVEDARHVSELTPWMKRTSIQIHLSGLKFDKLGPSYSLPSVENERFLFLICESVGRVLQKTIAVLVADQNVGGISQIAFSELQNQKTRRKYIEAWKRLMCYWERVQNQGHLRDTLSKLSDRQLEAWCVVTDTASELASQMDLGRDELETEPFCDRLDKAVLEFSLAIIQHSMPCASLILALCLMLPCASGALIYGCQMLALAQVLAMAGDDRDADTAACHVCQKSLAAMQRLQYYLCSVHGQQYVCRIRTVLAIKSYILVARQNNLTFKHCRYEYVESEEGASTHYECISCYNHSPTVQQLDAHFSLHHGINGPLEVDERLDEDFIEQHTQDFDTIDNSQKWVLRSGTVVEDQLSNKYYLARSGRLHQGRST